MTKTVNHDPMESVERYDPRGTDPAQMRTAGYKCGTAPAPPDFARPIGSPPKGAIGATTDECEATPPRRRGNWNVSPLWQAKVLLGVLRERGLAGNGLVRAFERWLPAIGGLSRAEVSTCYREQTGHELSDYILVQLADKVVRYDQLPPEAEIIRQILAAPKGEQSVRQENSPYYVKPQSFEPAAYEIGIRNQVPADAPSFGTCATRLRARVVRSVDSDPNPKDLGQGVLDHRDPKLLLTTNEVALLTGFRPKTVRRWVSRNLLNHIRVGNRLRFRRAAVDLFLAQREIRK
jgi:excisionase family DNA binding protein